MFVEGIAKLALEAKSAGLAPNRSFAIPSVLTPENKFENLLHRQGMGVIYFPDENFPLGEFFIENGSRISKAIFSMCGVWGN
jgi:hypothetical protein